MKIFAVYSVVELIKKPAWLDDFRKKYDKPYDLHITFKQPCWVDEGQVEDLKNKLAVLINFQKIGALELRFDRIVISTESDGKNCVMIAATENERLRDLQKKVVEALYEYRNYVEAKNEAYENNFMPHITIGREVDSKKWKEQEESIVDDCVCEGKVSEIILSVVNEITVEEAKNLGNMSIFKL